MVNEFYFSIIVPLYNKVDYLHRALESIQQQTWDNYEVLIVDDGSTDGSSAKAVEYLLPNWRLVFQKNKGVSSARNQGTKVANGSYLCFLDADDCWHPRYLEYMHLIIESYPRAGLYGTNYQQIKGEDFPVYKNYSGKVNSRKINLYRAWMIRNPLNTDGMVVAKDVFLDVGGFDITQRYYEDATLMFKIASSKSIVVTSMVLTYYFLDVKNNANSRMRKSLPLYPGYLPTLLNLSQSNCHNVWLRIFTKSELFLAMASQIYYCKPEKNLIISDALKLSSRSFLYRILVTHRNSILTKFMCIVSLKLRSLIIRLMCSIYD